MLPEISSAVRFCSSLAHQDGLGLTRPTRCHDLLTRLWTISSHLARVRFMPPPAAAHAEARADLRPQLDRLTSAAAKPCRRAAFATRNYERLDRDVRPHGPNKSASAALATAAMSATRPAEPSD